ncbi:hypothetical protein E1B06_14835 [Brevibacillus laterosporus]|uniref:hypothetical protein n=1 Tax=Brevibacillus laterosporus TaxID=1465 RepID=UPI0018CDAF79|nr:hypothetical protein [Brevibacillus laterosporus]MBG9788514.1 hypothetical protein [Brevibacillus laterosporus]MDF9412958.1 hypothetical protein [Brevibacillus laterosporus]
MNKVIMNFNDWYKERSASFAMENQIREEKLKQGVNGLEWLVLHTIPTETDRRTLANWFEMAHDWKLNSDSIMKDAIVMDSTKFYEKYELNWWITISETITYLNLLKQRDYNNYFKFIMDIERMIKSNEYSSS